MKQTKVVVQQDPNEVIERNVLAKAIVEMSRGVTRLMASGLNERAITCLIHETSGVGKSDIRAVLASLRGLEQDYIKRKP